ARTGMPCPAGFGNKRLGHASFADQPMGADLSPGIAKPGARHRRIRHTGIVKHDKFGALPAPITVISAWIGRRHWAGLAAGAATGAEAGFFRPAISAAVGALKGRATGITCGDSVPAIRAASRVVLYLP